MSQERISQNYNDPTLRAQLLSGSVGVGESLDSIYKRRVDASITDVNLISDSNASYNVIDGQYLIPKDGYRFNPMAFDTFQALYEFPSDFSPDKYPTAQDLALASPAKVTQAGDGSYSLVEKGRFVAPELYQQRSNESEPEQIRPRIVEPQTNGVQPPPVSQSEPAAAQVVDVRAEPIPVTSTQSTAPTLSEDQYRYLDLAGQSDSRIDSITNRIISDPSYGKQLDQAVIRAAESAKVSPEELTRLISNGPNVQTMLSQGASIQDVRNYVTPLDSAYRNRELEALNNSLTAKVTDAVKTGYDVLKATEKATFAVTPLPLESAKSVIQKVGLPLAATAIATRFPVAHQAVQTAIRLGGDMTSSASVAIAGNALAHFGQSVMSNLPSGLGIRSMAGGLGDAVTPVVMGIARTSGQVIGQAGAAIMTGNAIIKSGAALAASISEKGPKVFFSEVFQRGQEILDRAYSFTQELVEKVRSLRSQNNMESNQLPENNAVGSNVSESDVVAAEANGYARGAADAPVANDTTAGVEPTEQPEPMVEPIEVISEEQRWEEQPEPEPTEAVSREQEPEQEPTYRAEDVAESVIPLAAGVELSRENMDYALSLEQKLSQSNIDTQRLEISFNGSTRFKMQDYAVTHNSLNNEAVEMMKQALNDPANLKGEVIIKQGSKVLLHVKDGQVLRDSLRLTQEAVTASVNSAKPANTTTQALYQNASANVSSQGLHQISEVSKNAYRAGAQVDQVLDMNRQYNPEYKKQSEKIGPEAVEGIVKQAHTKVALEQQPQQQQSLQKGTQLKRG